MICCSLDHFGHAAENNRFRLNSLNFRPRFSLTLLTSWVLMIVPPNPHSSICLMQASLHWNSHILYLWSLIIWSMPLDHMQKLSRLCLLDISAAFDTIDVDILITRLSSWFWIHSSILNCYLSSRSFRVKCDKVFSSGCISSCGVPEGFVLGPLLFIIPHTALSSPHFL